jgi:hypothetical protein
MSAWASAGRPCVALSRAALQQRLGVLPQPAAGVAQDQPANQLAVVGREVLGDLSAGREADDVDRPVEPGPDPAGVVVGHVAGGMAGRQARPSCHLVDGVVAGVALVRPPRQPQGTPSRCLVLQREAFEDDQRFRAARDSGVGQLDHGLAGCHLGDLLGRCPIVSPVPGLGHRLRRDGLAHHGMAAVRLAGPVWSRTLRRSGPRRQCRSLPWAARHPDQWSWAWPPAPAHEMAAR